MQIFKDRYFIKLINKIQTASFALQNPCIVMEAGSGQNHMFLMNKEVADDPLSAL
jgi:hypothetical protein